MKLKIMLISLIFITNYTYINARINTEQFLNAARNGELGIIKRYQNEGGDLNIENAEALRRAALFGQPVVVRYLIANNLDVNATDRLGNTALNNAITHESREKKMEVAKFLLSQPNIKVNIINKMSGVGPLHAAIAARNKELIKLLLLKGADIHAKESGFKSPLEKATTDYPQIVDLLENAGIEEKENINIDNNGKSSIKQIALKELGLDPNADINPYQVLGVSKSDSPRKIKEAYFKKSLEWDPTSNPNKPLAQELRKIFSDAYSNIK